MTKKYRSYKNIRPHVKIHNYFKNIFFVNFEIIENAENVKKTANKIQQWSSSQTEQTILLVI